MTSVLRPGKGPVGWDAGDGPGAARLVADHRPGLVVHAAAQSKPDPCEEDPAGTRAVNVAGTAALAAASARAGARFVFFSSDLVHDGRAAPYDDGARPAPLSEYGRQKADAEAAVLAAGGDPVIFRLALCYGFAPPGAPPTFNDRMRADLAAGRRVRVFTDQRRSAIWAEDAAELVARLAARPGLPEGRRVLNLCGPASPSRAELAESFCSAFGFNPALLDRVEAAVAPAKALRPLDVSLMGGRLHAWTGFVPSAGREAMARMALRA